MLVGLVDRCRAELQGERIRCAAGATPGGSCSTRQRRRCLPGRPHVAAPCRRHAPVPSPPRHPPRSYHDLSGRPKHLWGVFKKMRAKGYSLGRISDVRGLRIIVDSKADCYRALRAVEVRPPAPALLAPVRESRRGGSARRAAAGGCGVQVPAVCLQLRQHAGSRCCGLGPSHAPSLPRLSHLLPPQTAWRAVGPTKDYIRRPKANGYRSLHTVVRGEDGHDIEVRAEAAAALTTLSLSLVAACLPAPCVPALLVLQACTGSAAASLSWLPALPAHPPPPTTHPHTPHHMQVQIRTAKMHFFAEYGAEAAHWQYKERGYAAEPAAPPEPAAAAAAAVSGAQAAPPASATSSVDDDVPTSAGAEGGAARARRGGAGGAAREANWAKFLLSQQVADCKYRPSGSPTQDTSLASLVAAAVPGGAAAAAGGGSSGEEEDSPAGSPPRDERFAAYLERSGQQLAPPPAERVVVAVVCQGGLTIEELPEGTRVADLVAQRGELLTGC